jgi:hypothetical protein
VRRVRTGIELAQKKSKRKKGVAMDSLYMVTGSSALGLSSAVILPILMLGAVVTSVAGLAIGIGRWKARHG